MNTLTDQTFIGQCACALAVLSLVASSAGMAKTSGTLNQVSIATQLTEVQRGTFDGRDYLTLHIGGHDVGPSSCRSNVLRMDTSSDAGAARQAEIETIALSAMLSATTVMVVVPLDASQCVDGKPTFTDLYLLPASP
jgi:hypothetical protein